MSGAPHHTAVRHDLSRSLLTALLLLLTGGAAVADDGILTEVVPLRAADATAVASSMGGAKLQDAFAAMAREAAAHGRGHLIGLRGIPAVRGADGGMASMLPEGLVAPPVALVDRNALLVRGTAEAIAEFRELVEALDRPVPQVRIAVDVFSSPSHFDAQGVLRWRAMATSGGPQAVPGAGPEMHLGVGDVALAYDTSIGRSATTKHEGMMVLTQSGSPALIGVRTERLTPVPVTTLDWFGTLQTSYDLVATEIATGLYVLPRVNADGTVTMHVAPVLDRPVGEVVVPGGGELPVVESLNETTVVTVADGQTLAIGGLRTVEDSRHMTGGPFPTQGDAWEAGRSVDATEITIFVTPTILPMPGDIDEPDLVP